MEKGDKNIDYNIELLPLKISILFVFFFMLLVLCVV